MITMDSSSLNKRRITSDRLLLNIQTIMGLQKGKRKSAVCLSRYVLPLVSIYWTSNFVPNWSYENRGPIQSWPRIARMIKMKRPGMDSVSLSFSWLKASSIATRWLLIQSCEQRRKLFSKFYQGETIYLNTIYGRNLLCWNFCRYKSRILLRPHQMDPDVVRRR